VKNKKKILITGGAGFIGKSLSIKLVNLGFQIRILDNLSPQVHGLEDLDIKWINDLEIDFIKGSVLIKNDLINALEDISYVVHLAAETGTGQSMYMIDHYFNVNVLGTSNLLELIQNHKCAKNVKSLVLASSRAVYGEGSYICESHNIVHPGIRKKYNLLKGKYNPFCSECDTELNQFIATKEDFPLKPISIYGLTKQIQEQACLMVTQNKGISCLSLRYQNVYGPGQSLKNPYTGILAIFSNLARQNEDIQIYEDGNESRDFVFIDDVVNATISSIFYRGNYHGPLNIGSGKSQSVLTVAQKIKDFFKSKGKIHVTGSYRIGDIRHNYADLTLAKKIINFKVSTDFNIGLDKFLNWVDTQKKEPLKAYDKSYNEMLKSGILRIK
jgi:dTDP-L-rhamnose 4-epimerase